MAPAADTVLVVQDNEGEERSMPVVCVMDASGPLGSTLVHRLLHRGYTVHATFHSQVEMRNFERSWSQSVSAGGQSNKKKLRLLHSDLMDYHSILQALKGCSGLFYSFEPPSDSHADHSSVPTYDELRAEMEVRAAHNVLEACAQTETMEKVVFTSSATAVIWRDRRDFKAMQSDFDERNWSDVNFCKKFKLWHGLSKTLAEKTAWALAMDRGVNMVSINGGLLMCALHLTITNPYLKGAAEMYEDGVFVTVELRFLVDAHVRVFEEIAAYGRYLCFDHVIRCNKDAANLAQTLLLPHSATASSSLLHSVEDDTVYQQKISNKKLSQLMVGFHSR